MSKQEMPRAEFLSDGGVEYVHKDKAPKDIRTNNLKLKDFNVNIEFETDSRLRRWLKKCKRKWETVIGLDRYKEEIFMLKKDIEMIKVEYNIGEAELQGVRYKRASYGMVIIKNEDLGFTWTGAEDD